jgi:hypothetical protein
MYNFDYISCWALFSFASRNIGEDRVKRRRICIAQFIRENLRPLPNRILPLQTSIGFHVKFLEFLDWTKLVSLAKVPSPRPTRPKLLYVALRSLVSVLKVADLEREVLKQKELRIMYRKRMETTQDYLKYCLQVAKENGFLDLIIQNKDDQQGIKDALPTNIVSPRITSPHQLPTQVPQLPNLAFTIDQAKMNGWYIESHEVRPPVLIGITTLFIRPLQKDKNTTYNSHLYVHVT